MTTASKIITALKQGEGLLFSFNKKADGTPTNFAGYDADKIKGIWDFIKSQNYFDGIGYRQPEQTAVFRRMVSGEPLQTASQRQTRLNATIATMDPDTLAKFAAFVHHEEKFKIGYLADRIADGSMATLVSRISEIGPRLVNDINYPGSTFTTAAPAPIGAVA